MANDDFSNLLKFLQIRFKNTQLLSQAFIHRSFLNEVKAPLKSNERLEFLGDSVLSLLISQYLFLVREADAEGDLTNLRAYIVKTKSLAQAAQRLNLGKYLKLSKGEEMGGGRENPQLLANTFEALLGAVYLDQGMEGAKKMVDRILLPIFEDEIKHGPPQDAKSSLQELAQEKLKQSPVYKTLKTYGPDHAKQFLVGVYLEGKEMGRGEGSSKQEAEEKGAKEALRKLTF
ncbi:MAG: ribonuclease III [Candidatus Daviesbacteria bacterium]|nr:ribonuclease III [Candidatus Daviesbacteria bacterium]